MLKKAELDKLIAKFEKEYDTAFMNYQETGITRYETKARRAEEMADALIMARDAAEDHSKLLTYRSALYGWAVKVRNIHRSGDSAEGLLREIVSFARMQGLIEKEEDMHDYS